MWILHAEGSMNVDAIRYALATCPEAFHFQQARLMPESVILGASRGLIVLDKESQVFRLVRKNASHLFTVLVH